MGGTTIAVDRICCLRKARGKTCKLPQAVNLSYARMEKARIFRSLNCDFAIQMRFLYSRRVLIRRFNILEKGKAPKLLFTSDEEELSMTDKMEICKLLKNSDESVSFFVTYLVIDSAQLPENPTFTNKEGRKYRIFV